MRLPKRQIKIPPIPDKDQLSAKTFLRDDQVLPGRTVYEHGIVAGLIARELIKLFSKTGQKLFADAAPAVALHDIGKINPPFYVRMHLACGECSPLIEEIMNFLHASDPQALMQCEKAFGFHAGLSCQSFLNAFAQSDLDEVGKVLARHHGFSPEANFRDNPKSNLMAGGPEWETLRQEILGKLLQYFEAKSFSPLEHTRSLLWSGLTSVSDWLASSSDFDDPKEDYVPKIKEVLKKNGFIKPLFSKELSFGELFCSNKGEPFVPNSMQQVLYENIKAGGVYVVQAPMGLGKTEAAFYAAYRLLAADEARGIYAAMPTRLTASQIHNRVQDFLKRALLPESAVQGAFLIHSKAPEILSQAGAEADVGGAFYKGSRRKILAPFAVGTIDQSLLAVLAVKFYFVRLFGLADKVVILDEVHSYDVYVSTLLRILVEQLKASGATVIILSATLTKRAASRLLDCREEDLSVPYPVICCSEQGKVRSLPITDVPESSCDMRLCQDEEQAFEEAFNRALSGEQVLWIENTVKEAQRVLHLFEERFAGLADKPALGLLHSRFTIRDRRLNEGRWLERLGKAGFRLRAQSGAVLVGTQVLEQSLDIDADCLYTRLCPMDFLLQRLGRTWRFAATPRPKGCRRTCTILAPVTAKVISDGYAAFGKSAYVYEPYTLLRTLEILEKRGDWRLSLPQDVQSILEEVYSDRQEESVFEEFKTMLSEGCPALHHPGAHKLESMALNLQSADRPILDETVMTRYFTLPTAHCLLLKKEPEFSDDGTLRLDLADGGIVELASNLKAQSRDALNSTAASLEDNILEVPSYEFKGCAMDGALKKKLASLFKLLRLGASDNLLLITAEGEQAGVVTGEAETRCGAWRYSQLYGFERLEKD